MKQLYVHQEINAEIQSIAGLYQVMEEDRLSINGRELFYVLLSASLETSCFANRSFMNIRVPGYIVEWKYDTNESGNKISEVEPIIDRDAQREVVKMLHKKFPKFISIYFN
jgi:hypothetical protein